MKLYRIGIHDRRLVFSDNIENKNMYDGKSMLTTLKCKIDKCDQKNGKDQKKK
jgi:hypothetical protein